jgi:toxin HigB-1
MVPIQILSRILKLAVDRLVRLLQNFRPRRLRPLVMPLHILNKHRQTLRTISKHRRALVPHHSILEECLSALLEIQSLRVPGPGVRRARLGLDLRYVTRYSKDVIQSIRHKGLKRLYEDDDPRAVAGEHVVKLRDILARLDAATSVADMDLPGFRLHPLKGERKGYWAVTVRANWRVIFRFAGPNAIDVDYVDYH